MKRLITCLITLTLFSCAKESNTYKIDGTADGFADGTEIYAYLFKSGQSKLIDTLTITGGKFSGSYEKSEETTLNFLRIEDINSSILYFPENIDMKATLYKDSIGASKVLGGKQNEIYSGFLSTIRKFNEEKQANMKRFQEARKAQDNAAITEIQKENTALVAEENNYKKQFIAKNNNSIFSVMLISELLGRKELSAAEATSFIENLSPKMASSAIAADVKTVVASMKKADVGSVAPNFSAPTPTGETLELKEVLGKYTIIDFWASWCKPCRMENPNVVAVYNKYHDKGLNIISVSLDRPGQKDKWIKAIADDKMDWYHVSNLKFWQDPIAKTYSVRSIPATFLLDEDGAIIAKNLRGSALETKIASLFVE